MNVILDKEIGLLQESQISKKENLNGASTPESQTLQSDEVEAKNWENELKEFEFASPKSPVQEDYFATIGCRRIAVDMLLDAVEVIKNKPESKSATYEREWLYKIENYPYSAVNCIDVVANGNENLDVNVAHATFIQTMNENPDLLVKALKIARAKLIKGELDYEVDALYDATLVTSDSQASYARCTGG